MLGKPPPPPRGPQQPSQGRPPNPKPSSHAEPSPHLLWLLAVSQLGQAQPQRNPMLRQGLEDRQVPIPHARVVVPGRRAAFRTAQRLDPPPGAGGVGLLRQQGTGKTTKTSLSAPLVSAPSVGPSPCSHLGRMRGRIVPPVVAGDAHCELQRAAVKHAAGRGQDVVRMPRQHLGVPLKHTQRHSMSMQSGESVLPHTQGNRVGQAHLGQAGP